MSTRFGFAELPKHLNNPVVVVNPNRLDDLFKIASVSVRVQQLLEQKVVASVTILIPAKSLLYVGESLFTKGYIPVRLAHSAQELAYFEKLPSGEVWELDTSEKDGVISFLEEKPKVIAGHVDNGKVLELYETLANVKKKYGVVNHFPLFRESYLSVFWGTKSEALDRIFERIRERYEAKRDVSIVPPLLVATPNLDHIRMMVSEHRQGLIDPYSHTFLQVPDGYPPLVKYAKQSLGYQTAQQITGVEIFVGIMNRIGRDALPYTAYFVGSWGKTPYMVRDYFDGIYPGIGKQVVGISTPPKGFLLNKELLETIRNDINEKKPDFVFVCTAAPVQEMFVEYLRRTGTNFGLGFGLGRTFDLFTGAQKKEPWVLEKLRLGWVARAFTGKAYFQRVWRDGMFAIKQVLG